MKYKLKIKREYITDKKDSKGERTLIGSYKLIDEKEKEYFSGYTAENATAPSDECGKDKCIMPRVYNLKWRFTTATTPRNSAFANTSFGFWRDLVDSKYHSLFNKGFKNVAALLYTSELKGFEDRAILIHVGNTGKDTAGCILLGKGKNELGVTNSSIAVNEFFEFAYKVGIENISVEIV